jgi:N-acetylglucosamine-6-phosphate deacetylase
MFKNKRGGTWTGNWGRKLHSGLKLTSMSYYLCNCRIFSKGEFLENKAVHVNDGHIEAIVPESQIPVGEKTQDLGGKMLLPGFMDLQIYGGDGLLFDENMNVESLARIEQYIMNTGTTGFLITIPSRPFPDIQKAVLAVRDYLPQSKGALLGLHIEGPYLNPEKRGAHNAAWLKKPEKQEIDWLLQEGEGVVKFITLAPELVEDAVIQRLSKAGIVVSAGHSNTTYERYREAFEAGITHVTHLFNAMPGLEGRKPALLGAASDSPNVFVSIIADGQHVHFPSVRLAKKVLGERLYLITDAVTATQNLHFQNGAYFNENQILTGSALTLPKAVENCVQEQICSLEEAIRMASTYPAKVMGWEKRGDILPGFVAKFTVL